jgi:hypothetical protein
VLTAIDRDLKKSHACQVFQISGNTIINMWIWRRVAVVMFKPSPVGSWLSTCHLLYLPPYLQDLNRSERW